MQISGWMYWKNVNIVNNMVIEDGKMKDIKGMQYLLIKYYNENWSDCNGNWTAQIDYTYHINIEEVRELVLKYKVADKTRDIEDSKLTGLCLLEIKEIPLDITEDDINERLIKNELERKAFYKEFHRLSDEKKESKERAVYEELKKKYE